MGLKRLGTVLLTALVLAVLSGGSAAAYEWPSQLTEGAKGREVRALQTRLAGWFPSKDRTLFEIDGVFGAQTKLALQKFQENNGLVGDGIAAASTFAVLEKLEDEDGSTLNFDFSEFWQNSSSACSKEANSYAGTFAGGKVPEKTVKRNVKRMMWRLEAMRAKLGDQPIAINSGFRSVAYNKCINGATYSQHMYGTAADLRLADVDNRRVRTLGKASQMHGIGCYSSLSHTHLDLRLQNESLEDARFWWWPDRDEYGRDLADDGAPCYGEIKRTSSSVSASGAAVESGSYALQVLSRAELDRWKARGEERDLYGLD